MKTISLDGITYSLISEKETATSDNYVNTGDDDGYKSNVVKEYIVKKIRGTHKYKIEERRNIAGGTYFSFPERVWC